MTAPRTPREYPGHADYDLAVQNIGTFVFDPILRAGRPRSRRSGGPLSFPGGFAKAYVVDCGLKCYALRVWLSDIGDAAHQYHAVAAFFKQHPLPWFVEDFDFIPDGILVNSHRFPILRMEWVSGSTLGNFITENIQDRPLLRSATEAFLEMVQTLHENGVAHGDLQAENIIVSVSGRTVRYKLIDYDTLVVPALVGQPISSTGLQCYQHPRRGDSPRAAAHDDHFSELVICLCLLALSEAPDLWAVFPKNREKELLFLPEDFAASAPTPVFHRLHRQGGMVRWLAVALWNFTRYPAIHHLPPLEKVIKLAAEALAAGPAPAARPSPASRFDEFLKGKLGGQAGSGALPKSLLDDDAFIHARGPISPRPANRAGPGGTPTLPVSPSAPPGIVGESFASKMQRLRSAAPPVAAAPPQARPVPAPAAKPRQRVRIPRKVWAWAAVLAVVFLGILLRTLNSPSRVETPVAPMVFLDSPAQGKNFAVLAGLNMVWMAPGSFKMGDQTGQGESDEKPVHEVRLTSGYWLGESAVTQGQWEAVMGSNPSHFQGGNRPVENVSWNEAVEFCQKLTASARAAGRLPAGIEYRLPSEAQWEYACRAGSTGDYAGDLDAMAWYDGNSGNQTHEVKTKRPNAWGLYDMHGNVGEWCADWYGSYAAGSADDPTGAATGAHRVRRGGSWSNSGRYCRSAFRYGGMPVNRNDYLGFRLAAVPPGGSGATAVAAVGQLGARDERRAEAGLPVAGGTKAGEEREVEVAAGVKVTMCWVPAGDFTMGSPASEADRSKDETQVPVKISRGFWLAKTECAQATWQAVMGSNPSNFRGGTLPVENVSWNDSQAFIGKLRQLGGGWRFDLPSEAQWEYACRAGTAGPYAGDLDAMGWHSSNSGSKPHPVGTKQANAWGLQDMHGNVWEWCRDAYGEVLLGGTDPEVKTGAIRVFRGGSWINSARFCRSAVRDRIMPGFRGNYLGFRLAAVPSGGSGATAVAGVGQPGARDERRAEAGLPVTEGTKAGEEREVEVAVGVKVTMCWVPAGDFTMGSPASEEGHFSNENQVQVKISHGFWLAKTECAQATWQAVMGSNPSNFRGGTLPVENVSWNDSQAFIGKLRQLGGGWRFDLPSEAQWEYACRAGTAGPYAGDLDAMGWYSSNSGRKTHPVGTKQANGWGLQDMHGNVREWCRDAYGEVLPGGTDPEVKTGATRVYRGGAWLDPGRGCRSAFRYGGMPVNRNDYLGFRLAAVPSSGSGATAVPAVGQPAARDERRAGGGQKAGEEKEKEMEIANGVKVTMCWVPAGSFTMGSPASEANRSNDEKQVQVKISRGFWLAKTECTQKAWSAVMGNNPSNFKGDALPVESVSWNDAQSFIGKLGQPGGGWRYDLPSEAQWEYACRAGTTGAYAGDLDEMGWYDSNSGGTTHAVGTKQANGWGLQDMHGNVWEWCRDAYGEVLPGGTDPEVKTGANRVFRGGSWGGTGRRCRSANRGRNVPGDRSSYLGFRLAAVPSSE